MLVLSDAGLESFVRISTALTFQIRTRSSCLKRHFEGSYRRIYAEYDKRILQGCVFFSRTFTKKERLLALVAHTLCPPLVAPSDSPPFAGFLLSTPIVA